MKFPKKQEWNEPSSIPATGRILFYTNGIPASRHDQLNYSVIILSELIATIYGFELFCFIDIDIKTLHPLSAIQLNKINQIDDMSARVNRKNSKIKKHSSF
jgi:hypothetical protein